MVLIGSALSAAAAAGSAPFCVIDADDALWIDCERVQIGVTGSE